MVAAASQHPQGCSVADYVATRSKVDLHSRDETRKSDLDPQF
jgi:hypothetical protein